MPIPNKKGKEEDKSNFMHRCMSDDVMKKEYPDVKQRTAVCVSRAVEGAQPIEAADFILSVGDNWEISEAKKKVKYKYRNPKTGEIFLYERRGIYKKDGVTLVFVEKSD